MCALLPSAHLALRWPCNYPPYFLRWQVPEGPNKLFIGGLPYHLTASNVRQMPTPYPCHCPWTYPFPYH